MTDYSHLPGWKLPYWGYVPVPGIEFDTCSVDMPMPCQWVTHTLDMGCNHPRFTGLSWRKAKRLPYIKHVADGVPHAHDPRGFCVYFNMAYVQWSFHRELPGDFSPFTLSERSAFVDNYGNESWGGFTYNVTEWEKMSQPYPIANWCTAPEPRIPSLYPHDHGQIKGFWNRLRYHMRQLWQDPHDWCRDRVEDWEDFVWRWNGKPPETYPTT